MFYFLFLTTSITLSYFVIPFIISHLLNIKLDYNLRNNKLKILRSLTLITTFSIVTFLISGFFFDKELGNRFLHSIGGGFVMVLVIFFSIKDFNIKINRIQYLIISLLIVTFLGVINELTEYIFQLQFNLIFNNNIYDTWLDLGSNLIGSILAISITLRSLSK